MYSPNVGVHRINIMVSIFLIFDTQDTSFYTNINCEKKINIYLSYMRNPDFTTKIIIR